MAKIFGESSSATLQDFQKAAETVSSYTFSPATRSIFSPENLDYRIKLTVPMDTPLRNRFARTPGLGQATAWERLVSKLHSRSGHAGNGTNTSIAFADGGAPNETSQSFVVTSAAYKLLGRKLEVGGLAVAASQGRPGVAQNKFEQRLDHKLVEVMLGEEEMIISGDSASNSLEFDGLAKQITTYSGTASLLSASGVNVYNRSIFNEGGNATLLVANPRQVGALADELQGTGSIQRIMVDNQGNGIGGVRLAKIVNSITGTMIDVAASRYVGPLAFLLTERDSSGMPMIEMEDLIPMSRVDVPSSNFSVQGFVVEATVLKVIAEPWNYKITGLAV